MTATNPIVEVGQAWDCRDGVVRLTEVAVREHEIDATFMVSPNEGGVLYLDFPEYPGRLEELIEYATIMLGGLDEQQEENNNQEEEHNNQEEGAEEVLKPYRLWPMHGSFDQWGDGERYGQLPSNDPRCIPVRNIYTGEVRVMLGMDLAERDRHAYDTEWRGILIDHSELRHLSGPWQFIRVTEGPLSEIFPEPGDYVEAWVCGRARLFKLEHPDTPLCDRHWFVHVDALERVSFWERTTSGARHTSRRTIYTDHELGD